MPVRPDGPPHDASPALALQGWRRVAFLHWSVAPQILRPLLPPGLAVHTFEGQAWISLVPFALVALRPPLVPALPGLPSFPETNVRTYVEGSQGPGLWFLSADADRLAFVLGMRAFPGLAYHWSSSVVEEAPGGWRYRGRRRASDVSWNLAVAPGGRLDEPDELDVFLTARWRAYSSFAGTLLATPVAHQPWPLQSASAQGEWSALLAALGLPDTGVPARTHFSAGVDTRIGTPRRASRAALRPATA